MGLKEKSYKMMMSIPHLALLWDMRKHQRYELREGLDIEIKSDEVKIYALLLDICTGGMRIVSTDKRIEGSKTLSISVNDFCMELFLFWDINLKHFIEQFTKESSSHGLTVVMK